MNSTNSRKAIQAINWSRFLGFSLLIAIGLTLGGAGLLALGLANPPRASEQAYSLAETSSGNAYPLSAPEFTLDMVATIPSKANLTTAWGVWLSDARGQWIIIAINGAQYITVRRCPSQFTGQLTDCPPLPTLTQSMTYWQKFHHIQPNGTPNYLRINHLKAAENQLDIWLNNEWVYAVPFTPAENLQWGYWQSLDTSIQWHTHQSKVWINQPSN